MLKVAAVRGLQGNLTLSYTYITAIALLLAELVGLLVFQQVTPTHVFQAEPDIDTMQPLIDESAEFLKDDPADIVGLEAWLQDISVPVFNLFDADDWLQASFSHFPDRDRQSLLVATVDSGVLAVTPADSPLAGIRDITALPGRMDQAMFSEAPLTPGGNAVTFRRSDASVMVMPITDDEEELLGLMVLITDLSVESPSPIGLLMVIGGSLILFTILAAGIGTLFGYFTARRLTRRLDHLVEATSAWGKGDFSPRINDRDEDEIGQLGAHLTQLAGQLQALLARRENWAAVETRNHLARELHDSIKQQIFAIRMHLGSAETLTMSSAEEARSHLASAEALAGQAQIELKRIIDVLHPQSTTVPFLDQLRMMLQSWSKQAAIPLDIQLPVTLALSTEYEHHLLRIVGEALANVQKHSKATAGSVSLSLQDAQTYLVLIEDNGQGLDPDQQTTGFGLSSMRDRVAAMNGQFSITSRATGTTIRIKIPATEYKWKR